MSEADDVSAPTATPTGCSGIATIASSLNQGTWSSSAMGSLSGSLTLYAVATGSCTVQIADGNGQSQTITINATALPSGAALYYTPGSNNGVVSSLASGPDGRLWELEAGTDFLAAVTSTGTKTEYNVGASVGYKSGLDSNKSVYCHQLITGPDGNIWAISGTKILDVNSNGTVKSSIGPFSGNLTQLIIGPDGNAWAGEFLGNDLGTGAGIAKVAKITASGTFTEFTLNNGAVNGSNVTNSSVDALTAGPDGNVWIVLSEYTGQAVTNSIHSLNGWFCTPTAIGGCNGGGGAGAEDTSAQGFLTLSTSGTVVANSAFNVGITSDLDFQLLMDLVTMNGVLYAVSNDYAWNGGGYAVGGSVLFAITGVSAGSWTTVTGGALTDTASCLAAAPGANDLWVTLTDGNVARYNTTYSWTLELNTAIGANGSGTLTFGTQASTPNAESVPIVSTPSGVWFPDLSGLNNTHMYQAAP